MSTDEGRGGKKRLEPKEARPETGRPVGDSQRREGHSLLPPIQALRRPAERNRDSRQAERTQAGRQTDRPMGERGCERCCDRPMRSADAIGSCLGSLCLKVTSLARTDYQRRPRTSRSVHALCTEAIGRPVPGTEKGAVRVTKQRPGGLPAAAAVAKAAPHSAPEMHRWPAEPQRKCSPHHGHDHSGRWPGRSRGGSVDALAAYRGHVAHAIAKGKARGVRCVDCASNRAEPAVGPMSNPSSIQARSMFAVERPLRRASALIGGDSGGQYNAACRAVPWTGRAAAFAHHPGPSRAHNIA
ncbi:uncharacterized protein BJ171DRAFT_272521 [Polychytrium aggregatum]|uniref:uncharacterized protein n=1 Tax=Polychytrium aggregatum TaxID=110093 RepID=UPI0022FDBEE9|nr:uncharacterized protein BJ171DRAFT_272521 [Polychytrium aggregatum]KAI9193306.1 hypothetical protein BJ171DRAFT_272521 [Polychytrium aggregatum]